MGYVNSMILDASMRNDSGCNLSSYVINNIPLDHIFGTNLPIDFFFYFFLLYLCKCLSFLCIVTFMHSFHSAHIFIVHNSVICTKSFNNLPYFIIVILY